MASEPPLRPACPPVAPGAAEHAREKLKILRTALGQAKDGQLDRLVRMLDGLPERGALDELLAPLRPRLLRLRPPRPVRVTRLLFQPLDPLIVPPTLWTRGAPTIPRTALVPLAEAVGARIAPVIAEVERAIDSRGWQDSTALMRAGAQLWPAAGLALAGAPLPASWCPRTGLSAGLFRDLADDVGAVLEQVLPLQAVTNEVRIGVQLRAESLAAMLDGVRRRRASALGMLLALLLARLPEAAAVLAEAPGSDAALPLATGQAKAALLARLEAPAGIEATVEVADLATAGAEVRRIAILLRTLQGEAGSAQRSRAATLLRRLDAVCLERFAAGLRSGFLAPLAALVGPADDVQVAALEHTARALAELAAEARADTAGPAVVALLQEAVSAVGAVPGTTLSLADKVRLVEILAGPDRAWALLGAGGAEQVNTAR